MNKLQTEQLEARLRNKIRRRRLITLLVAILFLAMGIVGFALKEATKEVTVKEIEIQGVVLGTQEYVEYDHGLDTLMAIGYSFAMTVGAFLFADVISSRFATVEANGHFITVYRGMLGYYVFINGEERDSSFSFMHVVDTTLPDGVKISVSFYRGALMIGHISFSDHNPPIDI